MNVSLVRPAHARPPWMNAVALLMVTVLVAGLMVARAVLPSAATSDDSAYDVPQAVDVNPDPDILETTITADELVIDDIGDGRSAIGMGFNGSIPGPEIRVDAGQRVRVHFQNNLESESTGIHWHGIELANVSDGSQLVQNQVPPGESYIYDFVTPRAGVYWYHPHHHHSTNQVVRGLYGSLIVEDPNEPTLRTAGVLPSLADTHTLMIGDMTICKAGGTNDTVTYPNTLPHVSGGTLPAQGAPHPDDLCDTPLDAEGDETAVPAPAGTIANVQPSGGQVVNEGQTVVTNGVTVGGRAGTPAAPGALAPNAQVLDVSPGQGLRFQIIAPTQVRYLRLRMTLADGTFVPLVRVGGEGGLLNEAILDGGVQGGFDFKYAAGEVLMGPSERVDVVAAIPASASGVATLWTQDFQRLGNGFANTPTVPVGHYNVTGPADSPAFTIGNGTDLRLATADPVEVLEPSDVTGTTLNPAAFAGGAKPGNASSNITLGLFNINGTAGIHHFDGDYTVHPKTNSTRWAQLGDTIELQITNTSGLHHPFHMHGFSFQPVTLTRANNPTFTYPPEYVDAVDVPPNYTLTYRFKMEDRPQPDGTTMGGSTGRWVFHCHIFFHAVLGMMSEIIVVGPGGNERPYVTLLPTQLAADEGDVAEITGDVMDPDGDPVTMSANVGNVINNGDGTWTWSHDTSGDPGAQTVFITGTDPDGLTGQIAFDLDVEPAPPNQAPTITAVPEVISVEAGETEVVDLTTNDLDGDPLTTSITSGPSFATLVGGDLSLAPTLGDVAGSPYTVTVQVDDGEDTDSVDVTVTVTAPPNQPPTITAVPEVISVEAGQTEVVDLTTNDLDGDPLTTSITSGPSFATLVGGDLSLAPTLGDVAGSPYTVTVEVDDGEDTDSVDVTVTVTAPVDPPEGGTFGDFDGDGDTDRAVFRPTGGRWYINGIAGNTQWGVNGDKPVAADYDGDGDTEIAVFRPSSGRWYINGVAGSTQWGVNGDVPVPGDYDGDGDADIAVFRPSNGRWYVNGIAGSTPWGLNGDVAVPGDYDGDGDTDFAVFRPTNGRWYVNGIAGSVQFGANGDVPVAADWDGDGTTERAVFRGAGGQWFVEGVAGSVQWGLNGDVAVPGDYDGDGTIDRAVWRPASGRWYVEGIAGNVQWGSNGDIPATKPIGSS